MVALTWSDTLSLVITACWSPVIGNSRTSTFSILSTKGIRIRMPGWSTDLNSPSRLTTPTLPCWTIFTKRERNRAPNPTPARTAMMTIPNTSPADANIGVPLYYLLAVDGVDDEQTPLDVRNDDIGPDGDRGVGV